MKKTLGEVVDFLNYAGNYLNSNSSERSQLTYALQRLQRKNKSIATEYADKAENIKSDAEAEFCLKEKDSGAFLEKEVRVGDRLIFKKLFDKSGEDKKKAAIDKGMKTLRGGEIDFEPFIVPIPADLHPDWVLVFTDYVFSERTEEEEKLWYLDQAKKPDPLKRE